MSILESLFIAAVAVCMFGYYLVALAILLGRSAAAVPRWARWMFPEDQLTPKP